MNSAGSLRDRLIAAQHATTAAEQKIQRVIELVQRAKGDEEQRVPFQLRPRYSAARQRKAAAVKEIARIKHLLDLMAESGSLVPGKRDVAFQPVKQPAVDQRRAQMFTRQGMVAEPITRDGLTARQAPLPKLTDVPVVLQHCKAWLEVNGVVPKIFHRAAADEAAVDRLLRSGNDAALNVDAVTGDPYAVAQAVLQYFNRMKDPIVPAKLLPQFEKLFGADVNSQRVPEQLHDAVNQLEPAALETLSFLFRWLSELAELHAETRMEAVDLAEKFAPVLFRSNSRVNTATEGMIRYYSFVFAKKKEGRTFGISINKAGATNTDHDVTGYVDNRFDYMARGYS
jgi:hypothetical protein